MSTVEGQRQYIELIFTPWIFLDPTYGATKSGGNPNDFMNIYQTALAGVQDILVEAGISISLEDAKVQYDRGIDVTMSVNEEIIKWSTGEMASTKNAFPDLIINTTEGYTEEVVQILIANAQELLEAGYQMMDDVYGYSEQ